MRLLRQIYNFITIIILAEARLVSPGYQGRDEIGGSQRRGPHDPRADGRVLGGGVGWKFKVWLPPDLAI